jgi:hypothetical protein
MYFHVNFHIYLDVIIKYLEPIFSRLCVVNLFHCIFLVEKSKLAWTDKMHRAAGTSQTQMDNRDPKSIFAWRQQPHANKHARPFLPTDLDRAMEMRIPSTVGTRCQLTATLQLKMVQQQ